MQPHWFLMDMETRVFMWILGTGMVMNAHVTGSCREVCSQQPQGQIKICKVAGFGVAVGTHSAYDILVGWLDLRF